MNNQNLIQLIRESIQNYISEIDHAGENAACEAKINAIGEAITIREKKMNMDGIDEAYHDMIDKSKMKELASEVKTLKKSLAKYQKQSEKLKSKGGKSEKVEDTEKEEIIDEVKDPGNTNLNVTDDIENMNANDDETEDGDFGFESPFCKSCEGTGCKECDGSGMKRNHIGLERDDTMEEDMNIYEVLHMQKLAGIITEEQYNEAVATNFALPEKSQDPNYSTVGGIKVANKDSNVDNIMNIIKTRLSSIKNIDSVPELVKLFDALLMLIKDVTKGGASASEVTSTLNALNRKHKIITKI